MLLKSTRVRLLGTLTAAVLLIYPFIEVTLTYACPTGSGSVCGG